MRAIGREKFWGAYWRIYRSLARVRPYREAVGRGIELLEIKDNGRYLDLACGIGITSRALKNVNPKATVIGADNSGSGIKRAQKSNPDLSFLLADFNRPLPIKSGSLDGVFANNALYLAESPLFTLSHIHDVLKPGGIFVMSNPRAGASPLAILKRHLSLSCEEYSVGHGPAWATIRGLFTTAHAFGIFLAFFPFQLALKNKAGGAANFWSQEKWEMTIRSAREAGAGFETIRVENAYADQNITFALRKT